MKNLKIKKLLIDDREFIFRSGINFVIGANATGKTTIFNCIKYALGLSVDIQPLLFRRLELVVDVGRGSYRFVRENGCSSLHIQSEQGLKTFRARSALLDDFYQEVFAPKFSIGSNLTSIFPILDFCFISSESRLNSKSLSSALRLICWANDKLIATALKDVEVLRSQIQIEEGFLNRNEVFVADFLKNLGKQLPDVDERINRSLEIVRENILRPLNQKKEVLLFSTTRIGELSSENERNFSQANREIVQSFSLLLEGFSNSRIETLKLKDVISRDTKNISHAEAVFADFILLLSVARAKNFVDVNFPNIYFNDGLVTRSLDNYTIKNVYDLLEIQSKNNEEFQYIEFTSNTSVPGEFIVADLDKKEWHV